MAALLGVHCGTLLGVRGGLAGVRRVLFPSHSAGQAFARNQDLNVEEDYTAQTWDGQMVKCRGQLIMDEKIDALNEYN